MGGDGADAGRAQPVDATDGAARGVAGVGSDDEDLESWPGFESLPPAPPEEYPPARPFRRRDRPAPAVLPASAIGPAAGPEADGPHGSSRRGPLVVVLVAVVALVLVVPALVVLTRDGAVEEQAAPTTTTTSSAAVESTTTTTIATVPTTTIAPLPPPTVGPPDPVLDAAVAQAATYVATERGFPVGDPIPAVRLPDAEFEDRVRAQFDPVALEGEGNRLKLLGIIGEDDDYAAMFLDQYPRMIAAYFDPETKSIVARGESGALVDPDLQAILVHEVTHALDYRQFDLYDRVYTDPTTEQNFGLSALKEGDAEVIEHRWQRANGLEPSYVTTDGSQDPITFRTAATYELGARLVGHILQFGTLAELDRAFGDPPTTSEQIMHPEKYRAREPAVPLADPVADGDVVWSGVTGEYTTSQMLTPVVERDLAYEAAAGWGNDKGVVWIQDPDDGGLTCLRIAYAMDTAVDLDELETAFTAWAADEDGRTVVREGETLLVTSCAPVPPPPALGTSPA